MNQQTRYGSFKIRIFFSNLLCGAQICLTESRATGGKVIFFCDFVFFVKLLLPLLFVHGLFIGGAVLLWRDRRTDLPTNVLDAALNLTAARGCLGEDAFDGRDAVPVSVTVRVHVLQPGLRQGVLLGRQLLVELDKERQHALPDLQDLRHQLRRRARRDPAR